MKSQVNQIFIYVLTAIAVSLMLLFGYYAIAKLTAKTDEIELQKFIKNTQTSIIQVAGDARTVTVLSLRLPKDNLEICFVDYRLMGHIDDRTIPGHTIMENSIREDLPNNVFLYPDGTQSFAAGKIVLDTQTYLCIKAKSGVAKVRVEGLGDGAKISGT